MPVTFEIKKPVFRKVGLKIPQAFRRAQQEGVAAAKGAGVRQTAWR